MYRHKHLQFAPNNHKEWTCEEQRLVMDFEGTDVCLAAKLGRSEQAIQTKRHRIKHEGFSTGKDTGPLAPDLHLMCQGCFLLMPLSGVCDYCG